MCVVVNHLLFERFRESIAHKEWLICLVARTKEQKPGRVSVNIAERHDCLHQATRVGVCVNAPTKFSFFVTGFRYLLKFFATRKVVVKNFVVVFWLFRWRYAFALCGIADRIGRTVSASTTTSLPSDVRPTLSTALSANVYPRCSIVTLSASTSC